MRKRREPVVLEDVLVSDAGAEGRAVVKVNDMVVFVPFAVPGDIIDLKIVKQKRHYSEGVVLAIKNPSEDRVEVPCVHFGVCGGCKWQCMSYEKQLFYKEKQVKDALQRLGGLDVSSMRSIIGSRETYFYRNKLEFSFAHRKWLDLSQRSEELSEETFQGGLGFHVPRVFDKVLDIEKCWLQQDPSNAIRNTLREFVIKSGYSFYNVRQHEGFMRNVMIRITPENDLMVTVVFAEPLQDDIMRVMKFLSDTFPEITSLQYIINEKFNDSIHDQTVILYKGLPYITEFMPSFRPTDKKLQFRIQAKSFYQTNSQQAFVLYDTAARLADFKPTDVVYDLYTGTGTIAHFVADAVKSVIGIEYVEEAVVDARENALLNEHHNTTFYAGDMAMVFNEELIEKHGHPDVVITDPPRVGMHPKVIERLLALKTPTIIYISCNPATQARDLALLTETVYKIECIQPVDMFPHTQHVENIVKLQLH